jgi:crooked neck
LEAWKTFEEQHGTEEELAKVQEMMPTTRKRWRKAEDGSGQLEECKSERSTLSATLKVDWDLAFPDDERDANPASYKFFKAAQEWAATRSQEAGAAAPTTGFGGLSYDMDSDSDDSDEDEEEAGDNAEDGGPDGDTAGAADAEAMDED